MAGCRADGISTLRSVRYTAPDEHGVSTATGGQICPTVVVLREGNVVSYSAVPFGQSERSNSAHFADQAERLFAPGVLKPTWYGKPALMQNLESSVTLSVGDPPVIEIDLD